MELNHLSKALLVCWQILNDRNDFVFRKSKPMARTRISIADRIRKAFFSTNNMVRAHVAGRSMEGITWTKPMDHFVKINFNGLVCQSLAAAGFIIRDHVGRPVIAGPQNWGENTMSVAEATALREL